MKKSQAKRNLEQAARHLAKAADAMTAVVEDDEWVDREGAKGQYDIRNTNLLDIAFNTVNYEKSLNDIIRTW